MNTERDLLTTGKYSRFKIMGVGLTAIALVNMVFAAFLFVSQKRVLETTRRTAGRLATVLDLQVTTAMNSIIAPMNSISRALESARQANGADQNATTRILRQGVDAEPMIRNIVLVDHDGNLVNGGLNMFATSTSYADLECFVALRKSPAKKYYIGTPVRSKVSNEITVPICRALLDQRGRFDGILMGTISQSVFNSFVSYYDPGYPTLAAIVRKQDFVIVAIGQNAAVPSSASNRAVQETLKKMIGGNLSGGPVQRALQRASLGLVEGPGADGRERIAAYRTTATQPELVVGISIQRQDALSVWRQDMYWLTGLVAAATMLLGGLTFFLVRLFGQHEKAEIEIEHLNWTLSAIGRASSVLLRATNEPDLFREACEAITHQNKFALAWVGVPLEDENRTIKVAAFSGRASRYAVGLNVSWGDGPFGSGPSGRAIKEGVSQFNNNMLASPEFLPWQERARKWKLQSSFATPVKLLDGRVVAVLMIYSEHANAFGVDELHLFSQLGNDIGFGVDALRTRQAYNDALVRNEDQGQEIELFSKVLEKSAEGVAIAGADGCILSVNPSFTRMTGYSSEDSVGRTAGFYSPDFRDVEIYEQVRESIERNGNWQGEVNCARKSGEIFPGWLNINIVYSRDGAISHYVSSLFDVSDRKRQEQQQRDMQLKLQEAEKMRLVGNFASGIAHDFNNMIGAIMGFANFLVEDLDAASPQHKFASRILNICKRSQALVKQILIFARAQNFEMTPVNLREIVLETCESLQANLSETTVLELDICPHALWATGNASQISQIVLNLCVNANEAIQGISGKIALSLSPFDQKTDQIQDSNDENTVSRGMLDPAQTYALLRVSDNGTGIDPVILKRIFEPFFTTKSKANGTGLGLAVVDGLVIAHGGAYRVNSLPGVGVEFLVWLPYSIRGRAEADLATDQDVPCIGHERVLIVDDEAELCDAMVIGLRRLGYAVVGMTDARHALETLTDRKSQFDILIADLTMPNMTGVELIATAKRAAPNLKSILYTGFHQGTISALQAECGADTVLLKPITPQEVAECIRRLF